MKRGQIKRAEEMRRLRVIALLVVMAPPAAMAGEESKFTDEQLACVAGARKEYLATNAQHVLHATADGLLLSVDDTIALRRLQEDYCKQYAACLSGNLADATMRETATRALFSGCLDDEVQEK
jgi:hypothetical protein